MKKRNLQKVKIGGGILTTILTPIMAHACACGCGIIDVATSSMLPQGAGGIAFINYDYVNQNENWSGNERAQASDNEDKQIETHFGTIGVQYMFNDDWGARVELPVWNRTFRTDISDTATPDVVSRNWTGLGDIRLQGIYTGLSPDQSSGLTFGVKLPTGSINQFSDVVDRDTEIGSGSTDILLGAFHRGQFGFSHWNWLVQANVEIPVLKMGGFRPGAEFDGAGGIYYDGFSIGSVKISPIVQIIGSIRGRDCGPDANFANTGYQRILLVPGIEFDVHPVRAFVNVEVPVYVNVTGNQLVAPVLLKAGVSYMF
jgi:hypothetical protein